MRTLASSLVLINKTGIGHRSVATAIAPGLPGVQQPTPAMMKFIPKSDAGTPRIRLNGIARFQMLNVLVAPAGRCPSLHWAG